MKKYLFLLVGIIAFAFTSCSKDTTYQVSNKTDYTLYDVLSFEYHGSDRVKQENIGNLGVGTPTEIIVADKQAEKVKIAFTFGGESPRYYTVQYYYLEAKSNKIFTLDNETMISQDPNAKDGMPLGKLLK